MTGWPIIGAGYVLDAGDEPGTLWRYRSTDGGGPPLEVAAPQVDVDGEPRTLAVELAPLASRQLATGSVEYVLQGSTDDAITVRLVLRVAEDSPVLRFRYELSSADERRLTKRGGAEAVTLASVPVSPDAVEVRLSDYDSSVHSYVPTEVSLQPADFAAGRAVMGPLLTWSTDGGHALLAYEHGSQWPDAYLAHRLSAGDEGRPPQAALVGVKGSYLDRHDLRVGWSSVWLELAVVAGDRAQLQRGYRDFVLRRLADTPASRAPLIFANTWNHQERIHHWEGRPYLDDLNEARMLAEVEVAHRLGVDVFVIDTGWYDRTGDWRVDPQRFPRGLAPVTDRLRAYGMRLGLWFGPTTAALSSGLLARHHDHRMTWRGEPLPTREIWETEESAELCLVSPYADDLAEELIRCARDLGVTYFKWDAISQYGCDDPGHDHGDASHDDQERADRYAFLQPLVLARIAAKISAAVPDAIVDFDVTEPQRCVGLAFLTAGKYFLINNGPYLQSYDVPTDKDLSWSNSNLYFHPGPARSWVCRTPLVYDSWIPSVLFLTHYLPDDPATNQLISVGSLLLGQNGLWGDLLSISEDGVELIGTMINAYRNVRDAVTRSTLRRSGVPGGMIETYEKIDPATGRGLAVIIANHVAAPFDADRPLVAELVTSTPVADGAMADDDVELLRLPDGRVLIKASFTTSSAALVIFGS